MKYVGSKTQRYIRERVRQRGAELAERTAMMRRREAAQKRTRLERLLLQRLQARRTDDAEV